MWRQADTKGNAGKPISALWEDGTRWGDWQQSPCHGSPGVGRDRVCHGEVPVVSEDEAAPQRQRWKETRGLKAGETRCRLDPDSATVTAFAGKMKWVLPIPRVC